MYIFGALGYFSQDGLDILLKKWDIKRNIARDQIYKKLSLKRKEDLLSQIALNTFEQGDYFSKQKEIEQEIVQYIRNLPDAHSIEESLHLDSEDILKSIEAQHGLLVERARGIYSFSHLTFHEYFAARKIVSRSHFDPSWSQLIPHIIEKRWREVFLLTVGMLDNSDSLLLGMKQQSDSLLEGDEELQQFFAWVDQASRSESNIHNLSSVRDFYFNIAIAIAQIRDIARSVVCDITLLIPFSDFRSRALDLDRTLDLALDLNFDFAPELKRMLQTIKDELPKPVVENCPIFYDWWQFRGEEWIKKFNLMLNQHRSIGYDWQFSAKQEELLRKYYDANKLLVDCLNSDCYVSREVRQEIERSLLLLPIRHIESPSPINSPSDTSTDADHSAPTPPLC
jgi:hypothetical protein